MTTLPFFQVDAFADRPFAGNPAAVMPLDRWLDDAVLLAIAAENNLSETAFTVPTVGGEADYELRWFTPTVEVVLCGHATLAAGHVLMGERDAVRFSTRRSGLLQVTRRAEDYALSLPALPPAPQPMPEIVHAIGGEPTETLWHSGRYSVLVYPDARSVMALTPDHAALRPFGDFLYIATAPGTETDVVSRVFAPGVGIDEDPVTGSAHAVLTPYWAERLGRADFTAFQASARGGSLRCMLDGDRVVIGGRCCTVIEGTFRL